jgi:hypothetical protein
MSIGISSSLNNNLPCTSGELWLGNCNNYSPSRCTNYKKTRMPWNAKKSKCKYALERPKSLCASPLISLATGNLEKSPAMSSINAWSMCYQYICTPCCSPQPSLLTSPHYSQLLAQSLHHLKRDILSHVKPEPGLSHPLALNLESNKFKK